MSQRSIPAARSECAKALSIVKPDDNETLAEIQATQGLIEIVGGIIAAQGRVVREAAATRAQKFLCNTKSNVLLALAEAQLEAGDPKAALATALKSQDIFATIHEPEREWRAWLIAGFAKDRLAINSGIQEATRAQALFDRLKRMWGDEPFQNHNRRSDIDRYRNQINALLARSN